MSFTLERYLSAIRSGRIVDVGWDADDFSKRGVTDDALADALLANEEVEILYLSMFRWKPNDENNPLRDWPRFMQVIASHPTVREIGYHGPSKYDPITTYPGPLPIDRSFVDALTAEESSHQVRTLTVAYAILGPGTARSILQWAVKHACSITFNQCPWNGDEGGQHKPTQEGSSSSAAGPIPDKSGEVVLPTLFLDGAYCPFALAILNMLQRHHVAVDKFRISFHFLEEDQIRQVYEAVATTVVPTVNHYVFNSSHYNVTEPLFQALTNNGRALRTLELAGINLHPSCKQAFLDLVLSNKSPKLENLISASTDSMRPYNAMNEGDFHHLMSSLRSLKLGVCCLEDLMRGQAHSLFASRVAFSNLMDAIQHPTSKLQELDLRLDDDRKTKRIVALQNCIRNSSSLTTLRLQLSPWKESPRQEEWLLENKEGLLESLKVNTTLTFVQVQQFFPSVCRELQNFFTPEQEELVQSYCLRNSSGGGGGNARPELSQESTAETHDGAGPGTAAVVDVATMADAANSGSKRKASDLTSSSSVQYDKEDHYTAAS